MQVAILGYGAIAREHALSLRRIGQEPFDGDISLSAVMGRLPAPTRAFADEFGAAIATTDLNELLADPGIEAVIICSPTDRHAEQTERALRAGKHVLCEIPLATSLAATDRLIDLAERSGLRLMVCHTQRYGAPLIEARRMIASGEVRPRAMVSRYLLDKRENVELDRSPSQLDRQPPLASRLPRRRRGVVAARGRGDRCRGTGGGPRCASGDSDGSGDPTANDG